MKSFILSSSLELFKSFFTAHLHATITTITSGAKQQHQQHQRAALWVRISTLIIMTQCQQPPPLLLLPKVV